MSNFLTQSLTPTSSNCQQLQDQNTPTQYKPHEIFMAFWREANLQTFVNTTHEMELFGGIQWIEKNTYTNSQKHEST